MSLSKACHVFQYVRCPAYFAHLAPVMGRASHSRSVLVSERLCERCLSPDKKVVVTFSGVFVEKAQASTLASFPAAIVYSCYAQLFCWNMLAELWDVYCLLRLYKLHTFSKSEDVSLDLSRESFF